MIKENLNKIGRLPDSNDHLWQTQQVLFLMIGNKYLFLRSDTNQDFHYLHYFSSTLGIQLTKNSKPKGHKGHSFWVFVCLLIFFEG